MTASRPLPPLTDADVARFWSHVDQSGSCWLWTGSRVPKGYGSFYASGRLLRAPRVAVALSGRDLLPDAVVDHLCRTPACVRPEHLEVVSMQVNAQRGNAGLHRRAERSVVTHCPRGHEFNTENTRYRSHGNSSWRVCRPCEARRQAGRERPAVVCLSTTCGWRGRRIWRACDYDHGDYDPCDCALGYCPKCDNRIVTLDWLRQLRENEARVKAWEESPEGKADMAALRRGRDG